jgi:hypothetical protein
MKAVLRYPTVIPGVIEDYFAACGDQHAAPASPRSAGSASDGNGRFGAFARFEDSPAGSG